VAFFSRTSVATSVVKYTLIGNHNPLILKHNGIGALSSFRATGTCVKLIQSSLNNSFFPCQKMQWIFVNIVFSKTGLGRLLRVEGIAQRRKNDI
jgi:hypothetical protein